VPRYDYTCEDCGMTFEIRASMSEYASLAPSCSACDSKRVARSYAGLNVMASVSGGSGGEQCSQPSGFG
jgi:putative FmdB family regulatory protein